jgi:serine/threonine protein kinase
MFAPELIEQAYGPQADMWSVGCILYEMLSGHQAFPIRDHDTESTFYGRIKRGDYDLSRSTWKKVSKEGKDLLQQMLKVDPEKRITGTRLNCGDRIYGIIYIFYSDGSASTSVDHL